MQRNWYNLCEFTVRIVGSLPSWFSVMIFEARRYSTTSHSAFASTKYVPHTLMKNDMLTICFRFLVKMSPSGRKFSWLFTISLFPQLQLLPNVTSHLASNLAIISSYEGCFPSYTGESILLSTQANLHGFTELCDSEAEKEKQQKAENEKLGIEAREKPDERKQEK